MPYLSYAAITRTPVQFDPFEYVIVPNCIEKDVLKMVNADFPAVPGPGSHPPSLLKVQGHFAGLLEELDGPTFRDVVEKKFGIDLEHRPTMCTVRGYVQRRDGGIHTDSKTKIITVLLYLNEHWVSDGGRLRLLRNGVDLESHVAEVPPLGGTLLLFRRCDHSWHGHKPYEGPRRAIQFNWVTSAEVVEKEQARHRLSTRVKWLKGLVMGQPLVSPPAATAVR
jgi:SM-20-related protein